MKKEIIYFAAMLLCIIAAILLWEASPAIAEKLGTETNITDMGEAFMLFPSLVFSSLFNEARNKRKAL